MLQGADCQASCRHKRVLASVGDFAPLPAVAMRIMDMVADPDTMAVDLEAVLQGDVSLVAAVLKLANSAFYGLRRQVISVRHALVLLGKSEVQGLVLSRVMLQAFKVPEGREKVLMVGVWKHSLECALAAECVAEQCGVENSMYFLGGMLHDIGKLVVIQKFLKESEALGHYGQFDGKNDLAAELELLGCGHNELGSQLLHRWMFPPQLVEMVHNHHSYDGLVACGHPSQILILANLLCRWTVVKDCEGKNEAQETALFALLLRCGADSKIIPDEKALAEMENAFRQRLEERADLLEMLKM
jgi:putative nucleotidyltransferase with HDIG domain